MAAAPALRLRSGQAPSRRKRKDGPPTSRKGGEKWGTRLFLASFTSACVAAPITYFISLEVGDLINAL